MPRATNAPASRKRRKRTLDMTYSYRDRKVRKRTFRNLWVQRINAAARPLGITYSRMMEGLKYAGIQIDRKVLSDIAIKDEAAFAALANAAKDAVVKKAESLKAAA